MNIRKGRIEDIPTFEYLDDLCFPSWMRYSRYDFVYYFFKKDIFVLVAEDEDGIHGFIIADLRTPEVGHIITIDIHPDYRRMKLGTDLIAEVEDIFRELGMKKVILEVHQDNLPAQLFYSNIGYRIEKQLKNYYHSGHGILLGKSLELSDERKGAMVVQTDYWRF